MQRTLHITLTGDRKRTDRAHRMLGPGFESWRGWPRRFHLWRRA